MVSVGKWEHLTSPDHAKLRTMRLGLKFRVWDLPTRERGHQNVSDNEDQWYAARKPKVLSYLDETSLNFLINKGLVPGECPQKFNVGGDTNYMVLVQRFSKHP